MGRALAASLFLALLMAHHDFWNWNDATLVLGFLPVGLFYHAMISIGSSLAALVAMRLAWPAHLEDWAAKKESDSRS